MGNLLHVVWVVLTVKCEKPALPTIWLDTSALIKLTKIAIASSLSTRQWVLVLNSHLGDPVAQLDRAPSF